MVDILHITVSGKIVSKGMLLFGYSPLKSVLLSWPYWTFFSVGQISVWNSFCDMKPIHVCKKPWSRSYKNIFWARFIFCHFIFFNLLFITFHQEIIILKRVFYNSKKLCSYIAFVTFSFRKKRITFGAYLLSLHVN